MQKLVIKERTCDLAVQWPESLHPLLQRIYASRQITSEQEIDLSLKYLLPPDELKNISAAVDLLIESMNADDSILVVGDFDADGATSTALLIRVLKQLGVEKVDYLVPNRFEFGYGLTHGLVQLAIKLQPQLIITVDNGISSIDGVELAKANGIKVLVTDHHLPGEQLPEADVILNPNQHGDQFPSKSLAGVGVVFYLLVALRKRLREMDWFSQKQIAEPNLADYLDIVALGTVADVVPLDRNNRILVNEGLKRIRAGRCIPGIRALLDVAGRQANNLVASDLGFAIAPRLNAAGRLDDMSLGIACLLANAEQAYALAGQLDSLNRDRREIEQGMKMEAMQHLEKLDLENNGIFGLALYDESWHQGVIGILASRIKEKINRPVIVFAPGDEGEIKGSARSIAGVHIRDVLETVSSRHPGLILKFGGHAMAAGLTIMEDELPLFRKAFDEQVAAVCDDAMLENVVYCDGRLEASHLSLEIAELLEGAGPYGQAFPEPVFVGSFHILNQRVLKDRHIKLEIAPKASGQVLLDGIAFNQFDESTSVRRLPDSVDLLYKLSINEFRGQRNLQLMIEHIIEPV